MKHGSCLVVSRASAVDHGGGRITFQNLDGKYLEGISVFFDKLLIAAPIHRRGVDSSYDLAKNYTHVFTAPNIELVEIPEYKEGSHRNLAWGLIRLAKQCSILTKLIFRVDHVFSVMSTFRASYAAFVARMAGRRVIVYSGNDWAEGSLHTFKFGAGWGAWLRSPYQRMCSLAETLAMRSAHARILNGESLYTRFGNLPGTTVRARPVIAISHDDFYRREDTCRDTKLKLLCVSSVRKIKGTEFVVRAVRELLDDGRDVNLNVVGGWEEPYSSQVFDLSKRLGLESYIRFPGHVPQGAELLAYYRDSDILVLPTLGEGFPRVLLEAFSQSLPVVASRIPNIEMGLGGLDLVSYAIPGNAQSLGKAIQRVQDDSETRKRMIAEGFDFARARLEVSATAQFGMIVAHE